MMARRLVLVVLACTGVCSLLAAISSEHAASRSRERETVVSNYRLFQPDVYPERLAENAVPFDLAQPTQTSGTYLLQRTDDLEFVVTDRSGKIKPIIVRLEDPVNFPFDLCGPLPRVRIPAILFDPIDSRLVTISFVAGGETFLFELDPNPGIIEAGKTTWAMLESKLKKIQNELTLHVRLLPDMPHFPKVGDMLHIFRMDGRQIPGQEPQVPQVTEYSVTVDPDGYIWIPSPKSSVKLIAKDETNLQRRIFSQVDSSYFRLRVAFPTIYEGRRFCLEEIAESLACADAECGGTIPVGPCNTGSCDSHIFPTVLPNNKDLFGIRYHVESANINWTLVTRDGRRIDVVFQRGQLLHEACEHAHTTAFGSSIYEGGLASLTVFTDGSRNPTANKTPFVMHIKQGQENNPFQAVILPGDVIVASH